MHSDPIPFHPAAGLEDGAAVIHPVSAEALDEAAHKAAELADAVAHHTTDLPGTDTATPAAPAPESMGEAAFDLVSSAATMSRDAAAQAEETVMQAASASGMAPDAPLVRYNGKVFEIVQENLAANTALFAALTQAKSLPEAAAIQRDHLRRRFETLAAQGRDLASLAQTLGFEALRPLVGRLGREG